MKIILINNITLKNEMHMEIYALDTYLKKQKEKLLKVFLKNFNH